MILSTVLIHPFAVVLYNNNLYFSDRRSNSLMRTASSGNGSLNSQSVKFPKFSTPFGLVLYDKKKTIGESILLC